MTKNKGGRPTIYTVKLGNLICKRISQGKSVRNICKDKKMPDAGSIYNWLLDEDKREFFKQYAKAKDTQAELMFDELLEIADKGNIKDSNRARLRVDTRKWYLSKVLPKKFGEKIDISSSEGLTIKFDPIFKNDSTAPKTKGDNTK